MQRNGPSNKANKAAIVVSCGPTKKTKGHLYYDYSHKPNMTCLNTRAVLNVYKDVNIMLHVS